jgi:hypothetical protein
LNLSQSLFFIAGFQWIRSLTAEINLFHHILLAVFDRTHSQCSPMSPFAEYLNNFKIVSLTAHPLGMLISLWIYYYIVILYEQLHVLLRELCDSLSLFDILTFIIEIIVYIFVHFLY